MYSYMNELWVGLESSMQQLNFVPGFLNGQVSIFQDDEVIIYSSCRNVLIWSQNFL